MEHNWVKKVWQIRKFRIFTAFISGILLFLFWSWSSMAVYFSNLPGEWLKTILAWGYFLSYPLLLLLFRKHLWWTMLGMTGLCLVILIWYLLIPPSHNRDWTTDVAVLPYAEINGDLVTIHNIRNFDYHSETDFTPSYYDRTVDVSKLKSLDYILSYWDNNEAIAHTMASYGFDDGYHLCVSVETKREKGEPQTALRGIFRQYELIYILADERDLLRLRTDFRKEDVYVFPLKTSREEIKTFFLEVISRVNEISRQPEFYDTITHNCLTTLVSDFRQVRSPVKMFDLRRILNGWSAEMIFENNNIDTDFSYDETRQKCYANQYIQGEYDVSAYSKLIRPFSVKRDNNIEQDPQKKK